MAIKLEEIGRVFNFRAWFIDLFNHLKGQNRIRHLMRFAGPDEFRLARFFEQSEAIVIRQRLAAINQRLEMRFFFRCQIHRVYPGKTRIAGYAGAAVYYVTAAT